MVNLKYSTININSSVVDNNPALKSDYIQSLPIIYAEDLMKISRAVLASKAVLEHLEYPVCDFINWVTESISINPHLLPSYSSHNVFIFICSAAKNEFINFNRRDLTNCHFYVETCNDSPDYGYVFRDGKRWIPCTELKFHLFLE